MDLRATRFTSFISLFTSASTLVCCALPALFVTLGMGAAFAGLVSAIPQLIWLSEHKAALFVGAGVMLTIAGIAQYRARNLPCPIDRDAARACDQARKTSRIIYGFSLAIYVIGGAFAFLPRLVE